MTYDFTATVENITPDQAEAIFNALTDLLADYPDSTAGYHATGEDTGEPADLVTAARALIAYRDSVSALGFQLEKADDFIFAIRAALGGDNG